MKKILLTGSGGFVGGNLKYFFKDIYSLYTPRSYELDMSDSSSVKDFFEKNSVDYVIHCGSIGGARGIEDSSDTVDKNLKMFENILEYKQENCPVMTFGSGAMYGKDRNLFKVKENELGKYTPSDLYGRSKMLLAQMISDRKDVLCLNIFGCYGYNEKESRFPTYAISQNLKKQPIVINQNVVFDYLFVEDLVRIADYFINHKAKDNVINITPDKSISLVGISEIINEISSFKSEIIIKNKQLNYEYTGSNELLRKSYPEIEFTTYKSGLEKLYKFIEQKIQPIKSTL